MSCADAVLVEKVKQTLRHRELEKPTMVLGNWHYLPSSSGVQNSAAR
jgi:hypothetical protein